MENFCDSYQVLQILLMLKNLFFIIKIVIPIFLIVMLTIDSAKAAVSQNDNRLAELGKKAVRRIIAAFVIFLVPTFGNVLFTSLTDTSEISACYNNANPEYVELKRQEDLAKKELESQSLAKKQEEEEKKKKIILANNKKPKINHRIENVDTDNKSEYTSNISITSIDTSDLKVPLYYSDHKTVLSKLSINSTIATQMHNILNNISIYVKQNNTLIPRLETAGAYVNKAGYHGKRLAIDLFNRWEFTYNGKTYYPYANYPGFNQYEQFVCEVCDGIEDCEYNINYIIYEKYFKGNGWCWGGNWGKTYFDPMHFELSENGCSTKSKPEFNCSKYNK